MTEPTSLAPEVEPPLCPHCAKPEFLCVCDAIEPLQTRIGLLILQHPQEQDRQLGTAKLAHRALKNSVLKIGLSWPSLGKALGREADPGEWAVLHLGATRPTDLPRDREVVVLDKKGVSLPDQDKALAGIKGVVIFDGSWAQAKTLWWRNAWVLKGRRLALNPRAASLYGKLRREPRQRGAFDHRSGGSGALPARKKAGDRDGPAQGFRHHARQISRRLRRRPYRGACCRAEKGTASAQPGQKISAAELRDLLVEPKRDNSESMAHATARPAAIGAKIPRREDASRQPPAGLGHAENIERRRMAQL